MGASKVGRRGLVTIPAKIRERHGIEEGSLVEFVEEKGRIVVKRVELRPVEIYTPRRLAELLLANSTADDYAAVRAEVRRIGLDPDKVDHAPPRGAKEGGSAQAVPRRERARRRRAD